jgi:hypothetical protein
MAIEIKRTPVLEGNAAQAFLQSVEKHTTSATTDRVRTAIDQAKKILAQSPKTKG